MRNQIFVGVRARIPFNNVMPVYQVYEVFRANILPTFASHGTIYNAVIGPFRTIQGAEYMARYGQGNPHCRNVSEAEKLAKLHKEKESQS